MISRGRRKWAASQKIFETTRMARPVAPSTSPHKALDLMKHAVALSLENVKSGLGGPFGAVVAREGKIIADGVNLVTSSKDPTAHAEITAIRNAAKQLDSFDLSGCSIYTSCEPCPMCLSAIYWARLDAIYYVLTRSDVASVGFDDAQQHEDRTIPIEHIDLTQEALHVFKEWERKKDKVPY